MAVYKATYCYPYLSSLDVRITNNNPDVAPAEFLGCKVDTSNTQVTGYSIRLYDDSNKLIFPAAAELISPISELANLPFSDVANNGVNSGWNGTRLQIPFFQNSNNRMLVSNNALYYRAQYEADHIILDAQIAALPALNYSSTLSNHPNENVSNWILDEDTGNLNYNWPIDPETGLPVFDNKIVLDNEYVAIGDTILVVAGTTGSLDPTDPDADSANRDKIGLWMVAQAYDVPTGHYKLILKPVVSLVSTTTNIVIKKGDFFHNRAFRTQKRTMRDGIMLTPSYTEICTDTMWEDASGTTYDLSKISKLTWEITLYQGNGVVSGNVINYSTISTKWLDMTIAAGSILGSTPMRVQIANREPDKDETAADLEANPVYLPGSDSGDIVLQGTYIDLGQYTEDNGTWTFRGTSRVHVKNYDTLYGHVYPDTTQVIDAAAVAASTHCQFFKHSNNPDEILEGDIVRWGVAYNVDLVTAPAGTSATSQFIAIDDRQEIGGQGVLIRYPMSDGDTVVLTSQTHPEQNGVYTYYYLTAGKEQGGYTYHHFIRRAASYKTWAAYIGKIIYCERGDWGGQNIESLAPAGTYTLWDPTNVVTGNSALVLVSERPILLFPQLINKNRTYNLCSTMHYDASGNDISVLSEQERYTLDFGTSCTIDDQTIGVGDVLFFSYCGNSGRVSSITEVDGRYGVTCENLHYDHPTSDEYLYFTEGSDYGHVVCRWEDRDSGGGLIHRTQDLNTAVILKNSPSRTYISPNLSIENGMTLKLMQGKEVVFNGKLSSTAWITIKNYNTTLHYIDHDKLSRTSPGVQTRITPDGTIDYGLASYSVDAGVPWKYEIRSYFTTSNENSFYLYQAPYAILKKDGRYYTGLEIGDVYDVESLLSSTQILNQDFFVSELSDNDELPFLYYVDQSTISQRSIQFSATYIQFDQLSWESYRWMLLDEEGTVIQDTGQQYEGVIETTFYGLANETSHIKNYYVVLFITDEQQNVLHYIIKLNIGQTSTSALAMPFTAEMDCQTHSVLLSYQDIATVYPVYKDGNVYEVYDSRNESSTSPWDQGLVYSEDNYMLITGRGYNLDRIIDYTQSATLDNSGNEEYILGNGIEYGVTYSTSLPRDTFVSDTGSPLQLAQNTDGEFYFDTQVQLNDNYCGNVLTFTVEAMENIGAEDPATPIDGSTIDKDGFLEISVVIPDNFSVPGSGSTADSLNPLRNTIQLKFAAYDKPADFWVTNINTTPTTEDDEDRFYVYNSVPFVIETGGDPTNQGLLFHDGNNVNYTWFDIGPENVLNGENIYYYLQKDSNRNNSNLLKANNEFLELSSFPVNGTWGNYHLFVYKNRNAYFSFFNTFLGNINIVRNGDIIGTSDSTRQTLNPYAASNGAPSYWIEDRKYVKLAADENNYILNANGPLNLYSDSSNNSSTLVNNGVLRWPTAGAEETSYWNESPTVTTGLNNIPATWTHISSNVSNKINKMVAINRHPQTLSDKKYRITFRGYNISKLYDIMHNDIASNVDYSYDAITRSFHIVISYQNAEPNEWIPAFKATLQILEGDIVLHSVDGTTDSGSENNSGQS